MPWQDGISSVIQFRATKQLRDGISWAWRPISQRVQSLICFAFKAWKTAANKIYPNHSTIWMRVMHTVPLPIRLANRTCWILQRQVWKSGKWVPGEGRGNGGRKRPVEARARGKQGVAAEGREKTRQFDGQLLISEVAYQKISETWHLWWDQTNLWRSSEKPHQR